MRGIFGSFAGSAIARGALAVALATGVAASGMTLGAAPASAKEKAPKPPKPGEYSKAFVAAAGPLQATLTAIDPIQKKLKAATTPDAKAAAQAELKAAAANAPAQYAAALAAATNPQDRFTIGNWGLSIGGIFNDSKMQQQGIQLMLDSGQVPAANQTEYKFYLGNLAYNNADYATAQRVLTEVVAANYADDSAAELLADSFSRTGQPAQGLDALKAAVETRRAAGGKVPENWYSRANTIAYSSKLGPQAIEWSRMMAADYPNDLSWLAAGQLVREFGTFTNQESLDLGRFLMRSGGLKNDPKFVEREYIEYIEASSKTGLPGEVVKVTNAGVAAGMLQKSDPFVADALREGTAAAAKDRAALAADEKAARAGADGKTALSTGDSYLSFDQPAKAEEMFAMAVQKGGIDKDRALTRLGIAQVDQGKFAEAKATFAQVGGARADLAKLWWTYADSEAKAAGQ
jgi:hypothetical protein